MKLSDFSPKQNVPKSVKLEPMTRRAVVKILNYEFSKSKKVLNEFS